MKKFAGREVCRMAVTEANTRNSEGCFLRLKDGSVLYAYSHYGVAGEDRSACDIGCIQSYDEGETWCDRRILYAKKNNDNLMCPSLLRMENGDMGLFYLFRDGDRHDGPLCGFPSVRFVRSADEGETWSDPITCTPEDWPVITENGHVIRLKNGRILIAIAHHGMDGGRGRMAYVVSDDDGKTFRPIDQILGGPDPAVTDSGLQETMAFETDGGRIRAFARTDLCVQYESYSDDNGETWSHPEPNKNFPSPCSPMMMKKAGELVLAVLNPVPPHYEPVNLTWRNDRDPMVVMVSDNDTASFDKVFCLDTDGGCCYPDIFDGGDYALVGYQSFNDGVIIKIDLDEFRDLTLVRDGKTDYVIVGGENPSPTEKTAVAELATYLKKITGVDFPVVTDKESETAHEIVVGKTNREAEGDFDRAELGDDGFVIKTKGEKLFLVGGELRGTLYSVYGFLDDHLGCRFFTNDVEQIPYKPTLKINKLICDKQIPVFKVRDLYWQSLNQPDARVKLKLNGQEGWNIPEEKGGCVSYVDGLFCHSLLRLSEMEEGATNQTPTPCLNDEERFNTVLKNVRAAIKKDPKGRILSVTQMDNYNRCECDVCKAAEEAEGSGQGTILPFVNRIADTIKDESPDVMIDTFAYYYTLDVPKTLYAHDNVIIRLCSIMSCFGHPLTDCCKEFYEPENKRFFAENIRGWGKRCKNLNIWDYTTNFNHYLTPFPNLNVLRPNLKFFADNNVTGVFEQGAGNNTPGGEFGELRAYLLAKLLWNPYMSEEEYRRHMNDFLMGYYGTAGYYVGKYIDYLHETAKDSHFHIFGDPLEALPPKYIPCEKPVPAPAEVSADVDWLAYADNAGIVDWTFINESNRIFDTAMAYACGEEKEHVRSSRVQVLYYETILTFHKYGKRLDEEIKKVVSEADYEKAMAFAEEQRCKVFREINQKLRDEIIHFGIARLAEDCEYHPEWACNLNNEPVQYWREENYKVR